MGVIYGDLYSDTLELNISYSAILPEKVPGPYPVLYLLHGKSGDEKSWIHNTSLVRYASKYNIAILMPQVHLSYYTDMVVGNDYWTFLTEEFPRKMQNQFRLTTKKQETFVAGLSMGGYGAIKFALQFPERFAGAASLSGALDVVMRWKEDPDRDAELKPIFGSLEQLKESDNDLIHLVKSMPNTKDIPAILQIIGTEDFLYQSNLHFRDEINKRTDLNFNYRFLQESGKHSWSFWDKHIQTTLKWMDQLLPKKA